MRTLADLPVSLQHAPAERETEHLDLGARMLARRRVDEGLQRLAGDEARRIGLRGTRSRSRLRTGSRRSNRGHRADRRGGRCAASASGIRPGCSHQVGASANSSLSDGACVAGAGEATGSQYNCLFPMIVAKRYFVSGRVQGVGFRYYVQDHAAVEGRARLRAQSARRPRRGAGRRRRRIGVARGAGAAARPRRRACRRRGRRDVGAVRPGDRLLREMTFRAFAETSMTDALKTRIRHVPDFPKAGILFYDVTTLLRDPEGFRIAIDQHGGAVRGRRHRPRGRHREPRLHPRQRCRRPPRRRVRAGAQARKAAGRNDPRQLCTGVRHRQPRDAPRCDRHRGSAC